MRLDYRDIDGIQQITRVTTKFLLVLKTAVLKSGLNESRKLVIFTH